MTAFISRAILPDSDFHALLRKHGWTVTGQSFVVLTPLVFTEIPACDWLFFSSQNAVRFFFQNLEAQKINLPTARWAALGPATAKHLESHTGQVNFIGTGEPKGTAQMFRRNAARWKDVGPIVFPAANRSRQSVMSLLQMDFRCTHFSIYDNQPVANPALRTENILAFTSPMNAEAYFSQHRLLPKQRVAAIGGTTDRMLQSLGITETAIAPEASERGLAEAVLTLGPG